MDCFETSNFCAMGIPEHFAFEGELFRGPHGVYYIDFPFDGIEAFGSRKQVPVKVWFDGYFERKSLLPKGGGTHWLSVSSTVRKTIGKTDGDLVSVVVEKDNDPRVVDLPEDLQWLFDNEPDMKERFMKMGYSNQKFFNDWICAVSDPESRVRRINKLFEYLVRPGKNDNAKGFTEDTDRH
jgi:hypothetical protein